MPTYFLETTDLGKVALLYVAMIPLIWVIVLLYWVAWSKRDWYVVQRLFYELEIERRPSAYQGVPGRVAANRGLLSSVYKHGFADYQAAFAFYQKNEDFRDIQRLSEVEHKVFMVPARSKARAMAKVPHDNKSFAGELLVATPYNVLSDARKEAAETWDALHPAPLTPAMQSNATPIR